MIRTRFQFRYDAEIGAEEARADVGDELFARPLAAILVALVQLGRQLRAPAPVLGQRRGLLALLRTDDWDVARLQALAQTLRDASICGLGQAAPNPVSSLLRFFPAELARAGVRLHAGPPARDAGELQP